MYRLLIVDDEPVIVEGLAEMLSGYDLPIKEICIAYDAIKGLELFKQLPFDIVITDIRMPEMDGIVFLRYLHEIWHNTKVILLTGYKDFDYAQQAVKLDAVDYLLKPVEDDIVVKSIKKAINSLESDMRKSLEINELKEKIEKSIPEVQTNFLKAFLEHPIDDLKGIDKHFEDLNLNFDISKNLNLIIIRIDTYGKEFTNRDKSLIQFMIQNVIEERLGENIMIKMFSLDQEQIVSLIQNSRPTYIGKVFEDVQDFIYRRFDILFSFALLENIEWESVYSNFRYLLACLKQSLGSGTIITSKYENEILKNENEIELNILTDIMLSIKTHDINSFKKKLNEAFGKDLLSDNNKMARLFIELSRNALYLAIQYNINTILDPLYIEKLTNLYSFRNALEMKDFMIKVFSAIFNKIDSTDEYNSDGIVKRIQKYVQQNINKDLSLAALSTVFRINPSYLSRIFHQITGEQLSSYITRIKMDSAKRFLANESLKIYEIAESLGYNNSNYFAKVFKKNIGVTPQDYRNIIKSANL